MNVLIGRARVKPAKGSPLLYPGEGMMLRW